MKFTLSWLKKHLKTSANLDEILLALTDLGLEVENVVNPIEALKDFTIGKVLSAERIKMQINCEYVRCRRMKVSFK